MDVEKKQETIDPELMAAVGGETPKPRARRKTPVAKKEEVVPLSAFEKAMETIELLQSKVENLEAGMATVVEEPADILDTKRPYATHRSIGNVYYEQSGKKYDGAKRLIEE